MSKTVLIVEGHPEYFCSHRLPWARRAEAEGYDVHVTALKTGGEDLVRAEGFPFHPIAEADRGQNPLAELGLIVRLARLLRRLDPDLAHFITLRAVLYGAPVARLVGVPAVLNSVTGLGYLFVDDGLKTRWLRWGVLQALRVALGHPNQRTSFHNPDNAALFVSRGLVSEADTFVTSGSGVDPERFPAVAEDPVGDDGPLVLLPTRLLWHKGVETFVEAARQLRGNGTQARFVIVGGTDPENPAAVPPARWTDLSVGERFSPNVKRFVGAVAIAFAIAPVALAFPTLSPSNFAPPLGLAWVLVVAPLAWVGIGTALSADAGPELTSVAALGAVGMLVVLAATALIGERLTEILGRR